MRTVYVVTEDLIITDIPCKMDLLMAEKENKIVILLIYQPDCTETPGDYRIWLNGFFKACEIEESPRLVVYFVKRDKSLGEVADWYKGWWETSSNELGTFFTEFFKDHKLLSSKYSSLVFAGRSN